MARSIANGVELSLNAGNFNSLDKTIHYFVSDKKNISVLVFADQGDGQIDNELIAAFPSGTDHSKIMADTAQFISVHSPFKSDAFSGTIKVLEPETVLSDLVWTLNFPVYLILAGSFLVTMLIFYFVALRVSTPIRELDQYASSLITDVEIKLSRGR